MHRLHSFKLCAKKYNQDTNITKIYTLLKVNIPPVNSVHISPGYYSVVVAVLIIIIIIIILRGNRCLFYINYMKMT
jgi:hypothetical protein